MNRHTELKSLLDDADAMPAPTGEMLTEVHDRGDEATTNVISELRLNSKQRLIWEYRKTAEALQRLESGKEFGLCIDCGIPIEAARLRASPIATRCVRCQEKREIRQDERDATPSL
ncbi:MAG: TraR/DksA family transcriptional regulator [Gammaproteobacteria bacterium]|nr:TraR/DksA family transcriptional regulator [Gammaproteobacteria bacterium]